MSAVGAAVTRTGITTGVEGAAGRAGAAVGAVTAYTGAVGRLMSLAEFAANRLLHARVALTVPKGAVAEGAAAFIGVVASAVAAAGDVVEAP